MSISYLGGRRWADISREERFYCGALFEAVRPDPSGFVDWLQIAGPLRVKAQPEWDVGFEVCFYRDFLFSQGKSVRRSEFSVKRTFDLCLFSEGAVIIIEAKVQQGLDTTQCAVFAADREAIRKATGRPHLDVHLVALASSRYFVSESTYGSRSVLEPFDARLSWKQLHERYGDQLFKRADQLYRN